MKTSIFTLLFTFCFFTVNAQQNDYKLLLDTFFLHAENGFKDIIGEQSDTESNFFPSKLVMDIGETKIYKSSYTYSTLNWIIPLAESKKAQQAVQDFIETTFADTKLYKTINENDQSDDNNAITSIIQIYRIKPNGEKPALVFQTMMDKKQFTITIYEKH